MPELDLTDWLKIKIIASGDRVDVEIWGHHVASVTNLKLHPIFGGNINSGSVAFGGPAHYTAVCRSLLVRDTRNKILYKNFLLANKERTLADYVVGID